MFRHHRICVLFFYILIAFVAFPEASCRNKKDGPRKYQGKPDEEVKGDIGRRRKQTDKNYKRYMRKQRKKYASPG